MFYSYWAGGEPENTHDDQDCIYISKDGFWRDNRCFRTLKYVCKKRWNGESENIGSCLHIK